MERKYAEYLLNKTKEDYNQIAEDFSRTRSEIWPETTEIFDKYIIRGDKILDLGCGNGRYLDYFGKKAVEYFGVDNSEKLIELAKRKYPQANFQLAGALNLPFPNDFFDKFFSIAVFHHIPSKEFRTRFLKEAKRVLRPNGVLILTVWNFKELKEFYLLFKSLIIKILGLTKLDYGDFMEPWAGKTDRYYHYFRKDELIKLVKETGFKIKEAGLVRSEKGGRRNIYLVAEK